MGSPVLLGHSGRALHADTVTWLALRGLHLAALVHSVAEFLPAASHTINLLAALLWLLLFLVPWVLRYLPLCWWAHADGQPG